MRFVEMENLCYANVGFFPGKYRMPIECPHCGHDFIRQPEHIVEEQMNRDDRAIFVSMKCPECGKGYVIVFQADQRRTRLDFLQMIPIAGEGTDFPGLFEMSPAFAEIHRQAYGAYHSGWHRLAVIGFRTAIEILMKDYLIAGCGMDAATIGAMSLNNVIQAHYKNMAEGSIARGIQLLGNDCTHYINRHADYPPEHIERFYRIFVERVNAEYEARSIT